MEFDCATFFCIRVMPCIIVLYEMPFLVGAVKLHLGRTYGGLWRSNAGLWRIFVGFVAQSNSI